MIAEPGEALSTQSEAAATAESPQVMRPDAEARVRQLPRRRQIHPAEGDSLPGLQPIGDGLGEQYGLAGTFWPGLLAARRGECRFTLVGNRRIPGAQPDSFRIARLRGNARRTDAEAGGNYRLAQEIRLNEGGRPPATRVSRLTMLP